MFRASPWVPYNPSARYRNQGPIPPDPSTQSLIMNDDVDLDTPQISTLRDDDSPSPVATLARTPRFRVKLVVNENKASTSTSATHRQGPEQQSEDPPDEDEEEDQLIEEEDQLIDDNESSMRIAPSSSTSKQPDTSTRRKQSAKKKTRKGELKTEDKAPSGDPTLSARENSKEGTVSEPRSKKKTTARKVSAKLKGKAAKSLKNLALPNLEDPALSEGGTGTAASSPRTIPPELGTPEPDNPMPPLCIPNTEESALDFVPLPIYPLPTKPFPVQAPAKIPSGFAPALTLEKCREKARHWRPAHREIRGIAGGRWFARTWVGDKESEFATYLTAKAAAAVAESEKLGTPGLTPPKPLLVSAAGKGKKLLKARSAPSASVSATPSRSGSVNPEPHMPHATRAPTKMRMIWPANSEGDNDVEMAPPDVIEQ